MALTGVGPAMASGSQMCSGNWADLPIVPPKMNRPPTVIHSGYSPGCMDWWRAISSIERRHSSVKRKVSNFQKKITMPTSRQVSPTRVVRKAFLQALVAHLWK